MSATVAKHIDRILGGHRFRCVNEAELQDAMAKALSRAGLPFERERILEGAGRVDFFLPGPPRIALEVKVDGAWMAVARQVARYAASPDVDEVILASTRMAHGSIPGLLGGKRIHFAYVNTGAL